MENVKSQQKPTVKTIEQSEIEVEKLGINAVIRHPDLLQQETDVQLRQLHGRVFQIAANLKSGWDLNFSFEDLKTAHNLILEEIKRRGLKGTFESLKSLPQSLLKMWHPSGKVVSNGEATHFVYSQKYKKHLDESVYFAEEDRVLGIMKLGQPVAIDCDELEKTIEQHKVDPVVIKARWPKIKKFYLYPVEIEARFEEGIEYVVSEEKSSWIVDPILKRKDYGETNPFEEIVKKEIEVFGIKKEQEGNLDFKEGDEGVGILQTHERGLSEDQTKLTHSFGWMAIELNDKQLKRLSELVGKDVKSAYEQAQKGDSSDLAKLVNKIDTKSLNKTDQRLIVLVSPVSIHTDLRLHPKGESYWEGGEGFTPGNQFKPNKFQLIANKEFDDKILMNFKIPTVPETGDKDGKTVIRGPVAWMKVGLGKPQVFPPGAVGSTKESYSRFFVKDSFKWTAGKQDEHYKEFKFDGDKLKGRFIIQFIPTGSGERQWMLSRPKKQEYTSEVFKNKNISDEVCWNAAVLKRDDMKRLVTAVVLKPETTDAQGDIMSPSVIEDAAHDFVSKLMENKAKLGVMHVDFEKKLQLAESYITPQLVIISDVHIPEGSWIMTVKVVDNKTWEKVLKGEIRGFSVGGKATASKI